MDMRDEYIKKETLISIFEAKADMALGSPKHFFLSMAEMVRKLPAADVIASPCKVGQTVYVVSQGAGFSVVWNVYKATAKAIHLDRWGQLFVHVETDRENVGGYVEIERVFLTREEAEKALAEREGDDR